MKFKKLLIAIAIIILSVILLPVFGQGKTTHVYAAGGTAYAAYGTPTVDGQKDDRYNETMYVSLGSDQTARADVYALWDYNYVYIYADVWDKSLCQIDPGLFANTPWVADSLEVFVDRELSRSTESSMPYGNTQLRVDAYGNVSGMVNNVIWAGKENNFEGQAMTSAAKIWDTGDGYSLEMAIPTSITAPNGVTYKAQYNTAEDAADNRGAVGYDLMLNNAVDSTTRQDTYTWSAGVGASAGWNTLQFMDEVPEDLRSTNSEKVVVPGNFNIAAGAVAYSDTVAAFEQHTVRAVDGNMETYTQGLKRFWSLTVDFRYEIEVAKVVVRTHKDVYPTNFKVEYYNSQYNEWETLWEAENQPGNIMECKVSDQKGQYYITGDTIMTRFIRFVPSGNIMGGNETYSYALYEFQAYTPDKIQTVTKISDKEMPIPTDTPTGGGSITQPVPEDIIVNDDYTPSKVTVISPQDKLLGIILTSVFGGILVISATIYLLLILKGRKSK